MKITHIRTETADGVTKRETEEIDEATYRRFTDLETIRFFNRWGREGSGYCITRRSYTPYGRLITKVFLKSPYEDRKIIDEFVIE